eukprot:gene14583-14707_t
MTHLPVFLGGGATVLATSLFAMSAAAQQSPASQATIVQSVVVTANAYKATNAATGTKSDTPILETPLSVQVIPQQVLKDQADIRLQDALNNVSGVLASNNGYGSSDSFSIRGFDTLSVVYEDGLKLDQYTIGGFPVDLANVERIEVVKGPASVLYGQAEPGGLASVTTKAPQSTPAYWIEQQVGSYGFNRSLIDATGPVAGGPALTYRLNLDYQDSASYRKDVQTHRLLVFPSLLWTLSAKDSVRLDLKYGTGTQRLDNGIPFLANGTPASVSIRSNFALPGANASPDSEYAAKLTLRHEIAAGWDMKAVVRAAYDRNPTQNFQVYSGDADASGNLNLFGLTEPTNAHWTEQAVIDLTGHIHALGVKHTLVTGVDFYHQNGAYTAGIYVPAAVNIFAPVYDHSFVLPDPTTNQKVGEIENAYGVYAQDQIELPHEVFVLAGFRYDDETLGDTGYGNAAARVHDRPSPTPRIGVLWRTAPQVSLYASYTSNYGSTALGALTATGHVLPPQSAQQYEAGVKADLLDHRLSITSAIYQITKQHVPTADPSNPLFVIDVGEARSRGVELDAVGELAHGWQIIGGYSYLEAVTTKDNNTPSLGGRQFPNAPKNSGSLWTTYRFQAAALKGLNLGAGVNFRASSLAWESPTGAAYLADRISGYTLLNAMIGYDFVVDGRKLRAQLNVNNLLDRRYFATVNPSQAMPGAPISAIASLRLQF